MECNRMFFILFSRIQHSMYSINKKLNVFTFPNTPLRKVKVLEPAKTSTNFLHVLRSETIFKVRNQFVSLFHGIRCTQKNVTK